VGPASHTVFEKSALPTDRRWTSMRSVNCVPSPMIATGAPGAAGGWRVLTVTAILILAALGGIGIVSMFLSAG